MEKGWNRSPGGARPGMAWHGGARQGEAWNLKKTGGHYENWFYVNGRRPNTAL